MSILSAYNAMAKKHGLRSMVEGSVQIHAQVFDDPMSAWDALLQVAPREGWLQCQSSQFHFSDGLPQLQADWGVPLLAEAVTGQQGSISLGYDGSGQWHVLRFSHDPKGEDVCDEVRHLAHDRSGWLNYRRYWRIEPNRGYVQYQACFIGFTPFKEN